MDDVIYLVQVTNMSSDNYVQWIAKSFRKEEYAKTYISIYEKVYNNLYSTYKKNMDIEYYRNDLIPTLRILDSSFTLAHIENLKFDIIKVQVEDSSFHISDTELLRILN